MQSALKNVPGVEKVETKIDEREVIVSLANHSVQTSQLLDALKKAGFPGKVKENEVATE